MRCASREARRIADSAVAPIIRAWLEPEATANAPTLGRVDSGRAVFTAIAPGHYLLRIGAIGYAGRRDSVVVDPISWTPYSL